MTGRFRSGVFFVIVRNMAIRRVTWQYRWWAIYLDPAVMILEFDNLVHSLKFRVGRLDQRKCYAIQSSWIIQSLTQASFRPVRSDANVVNVSQNHSLDMPLSNPQEGEALFDSGSMFCCTSVSPVSFSRILVSQSLGESVPSSAGSHHSTF